MVVRKLKRDGLMRTLIETVLPARFHPRSPYKGPLKQVFSHIYHKKLWGNVESVSGPGSEVIYTEKLRSWLISAVPKYGISTIIDAPCGDFNWMQLVLQKIKVEYHGYDIVDGIIDENIKKYSSADTKFSVADICEDELPSCDLLIVRDCLFHLSFADINRFLKNVARVNYKYLLTTTHIVEESFNNTDIRTGDFRVIDLFEPPFCFERSSILERVDDYPAGFDLPREMILIEKANVPICLQVC